MQKILPFLFVLCGISAQSQVADWAYSFMNPQVLEDLTATHANGANRFAITGRGNQGINMNPLPGGSVSPSSGSFLAVYDGNASLQWIVPTVGFTSAVLVNAAGEVYVGGAFTGTVDFDPGTGNTSLTATSYDAYVQKFDASGNFLWACKANTEGDALKLAEAPDGSVLAAGRMDVAVNISLGNASTVSLDKGLFFLKISSTGNLDGAYGVSVGGVADYMYVYDMKLVNQSLIVCGSVTGIADFDVGSASQTNAASNGYDAFVASYQWNNNFELDWFHVFGDSNNPTGWDKARAIAPDADGNLYIGGEFTWTTDFNPSNPGSMILTSDTDSQVPSGFLLKMSAAGVPSFVQKYGNQNSGSTDDYASISIKGLQLNNGNIFMALEGYGALDTDPSPSNASVLNIGGAASPGIAFARLDAQAIPTHFFKIDTNASGGGVSTLGVYLLENERIVTAGMFTQRINFSPSGPPLYLQTDVNGFAYTFDKDMYIARYSFSTTNISEEPESSIKIINPFRDQCTVLSEQISSISIRDILGREISSIKNASIIDTKELASGLYVIEIMQAGKQEPVYVRAVKE